MCIIFWYVIHRRLWILLTLSMTLILRLGVQSLWNVYQVWSFENSFFMYTYQVIVSFLFLTCITERFFPWVIAKSVHWTTHPSWQTVDHCWDRLDWTILIYRLNVFTYLTDKIWSKQEEYVFCFSISSPCQALLTSNFTLVQVVYLTSFR